jgi:hypothetical protein
MNAPIKQRIREAFESLLEAAPLAARAKREVSYRDLFDRVFPPELFPRAGRNATGGGPPGGAMAFGKALRQLGGQRTGEMGLFVHLPPEPKKHRTVGEWIRESTIEKLVEELYAEGHSFVHVDRRSLVTFIVPHVKDQKDARVLVVMNGVVEEVKLFPPSDPSVCPTCGHAQHRDGGLGCEVLVGKLRCGCGS